MLYFKNDGFRKVLNSYDDYPSYTGVSAIHVVSRWKMQDRKKIKNIDNTETKTQLRKINNAKRSKTRLAWFGRLIITTFGRKTR